MSNMKEKVKSAFTNNLSLKLIAIIIAAIVWLIVVNVSDPEKTIIIYNIPVTVTDVEVVEDMDMVYEVIEGETVNITITGKRSVLNNLSSDDFVATASLKEMSKVNALPIEVTTKDAGIRSKITIEKQSKQSLIVELENVEEDTFDVVVEYKGTPAVGYAALGFNLATNKVDISAPISILDKIDKVVASCKLNGESEDFTTSCKIVLYDRDGNKIKGRDIQLSNKTVQVDVTIAYTKELPIVVETRGNPEEGYQVADITYSQGTVTLMGDKDVLDNMSSFVVNSQVSIEGETEDVTRTIDLADYLPEGLSISGESQLEVVVHITQLTEKVIILTQSDIDIKNIPDGLGVDSVKDIEVVLRGEKAQLDDISPKQLNASIDLKNEKAGKAKVDVSITIPDGTELVDNVEATVVLK